MIRSAAVNGINDQDFLKEMALNIDKSGVYDPFDILRVTAISNITDQDFLKEFAKNVSEKQHIRAAAIMELKDQVFLKGMAVDESQEENIRWMAMKKYVQEMQDQQLLLSVAKGDSITFFDNKKYYVAEFVRIAAIHKLMNFEDLISIAQADTIKKVKIEAVLRTQCLLNSNICPDGDHSKIKERENMEELYLMLIDSLVYSCYGVLKLDVEVKNSERVLFEHGNRYGDQYTIYVEEYVTKLTDLNGKKINSHHHYAKVPSRVEAPSYAIGRNVSATVDVSYLEYILMSQKRCRSKQ